MSVKRDIVAMQSEAPSPHASRLLRQSGVFGASELAQLQAAFEEACHAAGVAAGSPEREALASTFMRLAQSRCRDVDELKAVVLSRAKQLALGADLPSDPHPPSLEHHTDLDTNTAATPSATAVTSL